MRNIILGQQEVYPANPDVWSFKQVSDIVNGINLRLSNMAGGFPFEFNGTTANGCISVASTPTAPKDTSSSKSN